MRSKDQAKIDFLVHLVDGGCPCCFPDWKYGGISVLDVWQWIDRYDAWEIHEFILNSREKENEVLN